MRFQTVRGRFEAGWQGLLLITATYVYFLIFAQFGFLQRMAALGIAGHQLQIIMGAMAVGGITSSLLAPRFEAFWLPSFRLRLAFSGCGLGALLSLFPLSLFTGLAVSFVIGAALGLLTVTLVTHLRLWLKSDQPLLPIAGGVGLAYFICNIPPLFNASASTIAVGSALVCLLAIGIAPPVAGFGSVPSPPLAPGRAPTFVFALGCFTGLVWLDSAAFYIIQHVPALKTSTWEGAARLWQNGSVHFLAALGSAILLSRQGLITTLGIALGLVGGACLLLMDSTRAGLAAVLYPAGVSLYSVALVAYPSFLAAPDSDRERARTAGWLYAVAGWFGSGLGIGMGENLRNIPPHFVAGAAAFFFLPAIGRCASKFHREALSMIVLLGAAGVLHLGLASFLVGDESQGPHSLVERGRQVYIAEGCIHCHSQFMRPGTSDVMRWGAPSDVVEVQSQRPPLIGNRRQGPDLMSVGNRRSQLWLTAHFMNPQAVSYGSIMPSYQHLFRDGRGQALVAYLASLGQPSGLARLKAQSSWKLSPEVWLQATESDGSALFQQHCATCHTVDGATRRAWSDRFKRLPPELSAGPWLYVPTTAEPNWRLNQISRIIKFGLPGTDMPGHELLSNIQIATVARKVMSLSGHK